MILIPFSRIRCPAGECKAFSREGATDPAVTDIQPEFLQFLSHAWSAIALQAKAVLFADVGQNHHI